MAPPWAGVIAYNKYNLTTGQPVGQLWFTNPDGTEDRRVAVDLPEPSFPVWPKDGEILAVSSADTGRPNKFSKNVFLFDPPFPNALVLKS